mmetsp:Transcript_9498/g.20110  ORF Transcript_9498/g.20110 Transcript_9498/m.20110 type:complete len:147 (-) Transcript_9498:113-553(-)
MGGVVSNAASACRRAAVDAAEWVVKGVKAAAGAVRQAVTRSVRAVSKRLNQDLSKGRTRRPWVLGAGCAVLVLVATPLAVMSLGFSSAGISAGSAAAAMMSYFAGSGGIASGSLVAICQSIGATGVLSVAQAAVLGIAGFLFGSQL